MKDKSKFIEVNRAKQLADMLFVDIILRKSAHMLLDKSPKADVVPLVHGRWVSSHGKLSRYCSICNHDEPYKFADLEAHVFNYCPNCGAKMDLEEE